MKMFLFLFLQDDRQYYNSQLSSSASFKNDRNVIMAVGNSRNDGCNRPPNFSQSRQWSNSGREIDYDSHRDAENLQA